MLQNPCKTFSLHKKYGQQNSPPGGGGGGGRGEGKPYSASGLIRLKLSVFSASRDCETVKKCPQGNSSSKPDRTGRDRKVAKQSKMLNNSAYSWLGNKKKM